MEPSEKLRIAKLKILGGNRNMRLFECLLYKYEICIIKNAPEDMTAFVTFNNNQFEMYFSDSFIEGKTAQELVYIILHEQTHVLNNHLSRQSGSNLQLFGVASDHVINDTLDEDIKNGYLVNIKVPPDRLIINHFHGQNVTAEEVYLYLLENAQHSTQEFEFTIDSDGNCSGSSCGGGGNSKSKKGKGEGSEEENGEEENGEEEKQEDDKSSGNKLTVTLNKTKVTMPDGQTFEFVDDFTTTNIKGTKKDLIDAIKALQADAKSILNSDLVNKTKGVGGSKLIELIKEVIEVPLPWDVLVENAIKSTVVTSVDFKSWRNINKRLYTHGVTLPGPGTENKINTLIMTIDTSGSMSVTDFKKFVSIIRNSVTYFNMIIKIDHDYTITNYKELSVDEVLMDAEDVYTFTGRGGTSHKDVFDKIEELYTDDEHELDMVFILTDYESDIEQIWSNYTWTKEIPVKILSTEKHAVASHVDKTPIFI